MQSSATSAPEDKLGGGVTAEVGVYKDVHNGMFSNGATHVKASQSKHDGSSVVAVDGGDERSERLAAMALQVWQGSLRQPFPALTTLVCSGFSLCVSCTLGTSVGIRCLACKLCWINGELTNLHVQRAYRGRFVYTENTFDAAKKSLRRTPIRLHRRNLADRLIFESSLIRGFLRLVNQGLIFCLMVTAALLSSGPAVKRGIYNNLIDAFQLHELQSIRSRSAFVDALPAIARRSKEFFPLSSQYFDTEAGGTVELLGPLEKFTRAKRLGVDVSIQAPQVSFTVWAKADPIFVKGYIVQKKLIKSGYGSDLSCWGWNLDFLKGPQLHYGVHDVYPTDRGSDGRQVETGLAQPVAMEPGVYKLFTLTLTENNVTFWQNLEKLGTVTLPRPLTDCYNGGDGLLVGSSGLELGQLRFYPRSLEASDIQEIYEYGQRLSDMSTGSQPHFAVETNILEAKRAINGDMSAVSSAVKARQALEHIGFTAQEIELEKRAQRAQGHPYASSSFATGQTPAECSNPPVTTADPVIEREFYQLISEPARLSKTSDNDARYLSNVPDFVGSGMTLTFWYRHVNCPKKTCGVYLIHVGDFEAFSNTTGGNEWCWTLWIENEGIWTDGHANSGYMYFDDHDVSDKFKPQDDRTWRHIAYQFDEIDDVTRFFLDGVMVYETAYGKPVSQADCVNTGGKRWSLGHSHPGYTYGQEVEVADMRMYHHNQPAGVGKLSAQEIRELSLNQSGAVQIPDEYRCLSIENKLMQDTTWQDGFGNGCEWFHSQRKTNPDLCLLDKARSECPLSCMARKECFNKREGKKARFAWDRTRRVDMQGPNGTICLSSSLQKEAIVQECRRWVQSGELGATGGRGVSQDDDSFLKGWLESMATIGPQPRSGRRVNITDCDELDASIDEHCDFGIQDVIDFTSDMKAAGGDFTIAFWVKPLGEQSKMGDTDRFFAHINFFSTISPPQHNLLFGQWVNPNGEARINSKCLRPGAGVSYWNIEVKEASNDEWTFFAISVRNATTGTQIQDVNTFTGLGFDRETQDYPICLFDDVAFFNAIEINYPLLISPIMMVAEAMPVAKVQEHYLKLYEEIAIRSGPKEQNSKRVGTTIPVNKQEFSPSSTLMASPIIFQTRVEPTGDCPYRYSSTWVKRQHDKAVQTRCAYPFECQDQVVSDSFSVMSCPGEQQTSGLFFGLKPTKFMGSDGYADFLFAITDNEFVFRNNSQGQGEVIDTNSFIDSLTQSVSICLVFFTPRQGLTSVLTINADFSGALSAEVGFEVLHFGILEGGKLYFYIVVQSIVVLNVFLLMLDAVRLAIQIWTDRNTQDGINFGSLVQSITDLVCGLAVLGFIIVRIPQIVQSAGVTSRILSVLDSIPWESPVVPLADKKTTFFDTVTDLLARIDESEMANTLCNIILLVNLLRVIMCTSVHPRLALLTGTLSNALDDLFHTAFLTCALMLCFAGIGTWRFGSTYDAYSDFETTLQTQFELLFGEFQDGWTDSREMAAFNVIYLMVLFLLVLNFLLAIIIEAYMKLRQDINAKQTEESFGKDLMGAFLGLLHQRTQHWPSAAELGAALEAQEARLSVGFSELVHMQMFPSHKSVGSFLKHYRQYRFLQPLRVSRYGLAPTEQHQWRSRIGEDGAEQLIRLSDALERIIKSRLGGQVLTLRQEVEKAQKIVQHRRRTRAGACDARTANGRTASVTSLGDLHGKVKESMEQHQAVYGSNSQTLRAALDTVFNVIHAQDDRFEEYVEAEIETRRLLSEALDLLSAKRKAVGRTETSQMQSADGVSQYQSDRDGNQDVDVFSWATSFVHRA